MQKGSVHLQRLEMQQKAQNSGLHVTMGPVQLHEPRSASIVLTSLSQSMRKNVSIQKALCQGVHTRVVSLPVRSKSPRERESASLCTSGPS